MNKILTVAALVALTTGSVAYADTLQDTDNHPHDNAYNVNQNSEFFGYIGIRGGISNYFGDATAPEYKSATAEDTEANADSEDSSGMITNSLSNNVVGWGAGFIGLGYRQARWGVRAELEASFYGAKNVTASYVYKVSADGTAQKTKNKLETQAYMFNLYADAYAQENCVFYLMAGLGDAHLKVKDFDADDDALAWQVGIGGQYYFTNHFGTEIGLRYQDLGSIEFRGLKIEPQTVQLYVGLLGRF